MPDKGDSEGKRLYRWRAQRLSEAGRLLRVVDALLRAGGFSSFGFDRFLEEIGRAERSALESGYGRIEPRKRFPRGYSQPLVGRRSRNIIHLDESGQSFPRPDRLTDYFALAGIAMSPSAAEAWIVESGHLKEKHGIPPKTPFHEPDMRDRKGVWYLGGSTDRQDAFDRDLDDLLRATPFVVFGSGIRKAAFASFMAGGSDHYLPTDVYAIAIQLLLERYVDFLAMSADGDPMGRLKFESQGATEDAHHARDYVAALIDGTQWIAGGTFRQWLETGPRFVPKEPGGVEIADMFARDLYEWVRDGCRTTPKRWDLFSERIYCRGDRRMGLFGVKVFPDSDIRDLIDAHRASAGPPQ